MATKNLIDTDNETPIYSLTSLFKETPLGVIVIEPEGGISYANSMAEEIFEIQEQSLGTATKELKWKFVDGKGNLLYDNKFSNFKSLMTKTPLINIECGIEFNGITKWLRINTTPILEPDGSIARILAYIKDVSEEQSKKLKLEQSEANLRAVLNLSDNGYILLSSKKEILMINKMAEKLFHLISSIQLNEGVHFPSQLPSNQRASVDKQLEKALKGDCNTNEYRIKTSQGKEKWLTINYFPQSSKTNSSFQQVIVEIKNITKDRELENKLDDANEEMVHLVNNSLKSFFIINEEFKIIQYNKHAENETKQYFDRKPKKNESILPYISPAYHAQFKQHVQTAFEGSRIKEEEEREVAPGLFYYFEQEFFPSINKRSKKNNVGFSSTNITENKMTRQMLLKSMNELNKYKGAFYEACNFAITDRSGKMSDVNDNFSQLFNYPKFQLIGQNIDLIFPLKDNNLIELFEVLGKSGKMIERQLTGVEKEGKSKTVGLRIYPVKDDHGKVIECIFVNVANK